MFRIIVKRMLLSRDYLEQKRKSYPVFAVFVEKYIEENFPRWYEYLAKSACPICRVSISDPVQLYYHLTSKTRCADALDEIVNEIMNEYDRFYRRECKYYYSNEKKQLLIWLTTYGVRKTVELCRAGKRTKDAEKSVRSGVL